MSFKYLYSLILLLAIISCSESDENKVIKPEKVIESKDISFDLAHENKLFNEQVDSAHMDNHNVIDFDQFQLVLFQFNNQTSLQNTIGDTIFINEEMGSRLEHFLLFNVDPTSTYEVQLAYLQSIIAPTIDEKSCELLQWNKITTFKTLKEHENLFLDYTLPNYQNEEGISDNFLSNFTEIKLDALKAKTDAYREYNIEDTADISELTNADSFSDLNLNFYNSQVIIKIIQITESNTSQEFVLIIDCNWGC